jgi:uncharacterized membrane protein YdjX (TVP38/TMEM64 family)
MCGLAAAWQWTPLKGWLNADNVSNTALYISENDLGPLIALGIYLVGSLIMIPVTLMIAGTALAFGFLSGVIISLSGSLLSAALAYAVGRRFGRDVLRRLPALRLNRLSRRLARHGIITVTSLRLIPIAPFTVVNVAAGAGHLRFLDFMIGTLLGMIPGILIITLLVQQIEITFRRPDLESLIALGLLVILAITGVFMFRRWLGNGGHSRGGFRLF